MLGLKTIRRLVVLFCGDCLSFGLDFGISGFLAGVPAATLQLRAQGLSALIAADTTCGIKS